MFYVLVLYFCLLLSFYFSEQNFLGEVLQDGQCVNSNDETVGWVDLGKAIFRDKYEAYFCSITGVRPTKQH